MKIPNYLYLVGIGLVFTAALVWWNISDPKMTIVASEPGMDNRADKTAGLNEIINVGEFFERFLTAEPALNESWARFRGSEFDNIKKTGKSLIDKFDSNDPDIQWSVELGEGHAGPAIYQGLVYAGTDYTALQVSDDCFVINSFPFS